MRKMDGPAGPDLLKEMGYEPRDIKLGDVLRWIFALVAFFFVTMVAIIGVYALFVPDWAKLGQQQPIPANRRVPPHPQLQTDPRRDFELYRQAEDRTLRGESVDGKVVGVPVEQAIEVMASQRGIAGVRGTEVQQIGSGYPGMYSRMEGAGHSDAASHGGTHSGAAEQGQQTHSEGDSHGVAGAHTKGAGAMTPAGGGHGAQEHGGSH